MFLFIYIYLLNMMSKMIAIEKTAIPTAPPDRKGTRNEDCADNEKENIFVNGMQKTSKIPAKLEKYYYRYFINKMLD